MSYEKRCLFGGTISINLPDNFQDVSKFRQVPDNQEVFVYKQSDASIIIELLETPSNLDEEALGVEFHWQDLCLENEATETKIESTGSLDIKFEESEDENINIYQFNSYIFGSQIIPKYGKLKDLSKVCIRLFLLRIPSITSDILISFSNDESDHFFTDEMFFEICKSFKIKDWGLFK